MDPDDLRYIYENHEKFGPLPTFFILAGSSGALRNVNVMDAIPGKSVGLENLLHGEHYIEFYKELPTEGKLKTSGKIVEVLDKGSGAVVVIEGEEICTRRNPLFK